MGKGLGKVYKYRFHIMKYKRAIMTTCLIILGVLSHVDTVDEKLPALRYNKNKTGVEVCKRKLVITHHLVSSNSLRARRGYVT